MSSHTQNPSGAQQSQNSSGSQAGMLGALPSELLNKVLGHCDTDSLAALAPTCKKLNEIVTPMLWRSVDLRYDNPRFNGGEFKPESRNHLMKILTSDSSSLQELYRVTDWWLAQQSFIRAVMTRPELGLLVHVFAWTLYTATTPLEEEYPEEVYASEREYPGTAAVDMFERLVNVQNLQIDGLGPDRVFIETSRPKINTIFPAASTISLSGDLPLLFHRKLFLSINRARLTALTLDAVQDPPWHIEWRGAYFAEPMRDILSHYLTGHCRSLKKFTLRWPSRFNQGGAFKEYLKFIASVPTLESFTFDMFDGPAPVIAADPGPVRDNLALFFQERLLGLFTRLEWPFLAHIAITGLRIMPEREAGFRVAVRERVKPGCAIIIRWAPERDGDVTYEEPKED
ncbi:MAG: hypothetical protein M1816_000648 [Peltula sp. TS41687]|nr:MAG: hypothetical protein M1816_000648 [Peltula sp. TS41687]